METHLNIMHKGPQSWQGYPRQMAETAALHVKDHNITLREPVFRQLDIVEHTEDADRVGEVQLAVVKIGEPVEEYVVAFGSLVWEGYHVAGNLKKF